MNPLIQKLMDGANLEEHVASKAVEVVASFLEEKLPEPAKSMAANIVRGAEGTDLGDVAGSVMDKVGKLF